MRYQKANDILPENLVELIQNYIDGGYVYIPRKQENRKNWGEASLAKEELRERNRAEMGGKSNAFTVQVTDTTLPCQSMEWQEAEVWLGGCLKPRIDALFAKEMGISRNQVKRLCESGQICTFEGNADSGARVKDGQIFYFRRKESVFG